MNVIPLVVSNKTITFATELRNIVNNQLKVMTYTEVYNIINSLETKESNVTITTKLSQKQYRQNLYISSANQVKIRNVGSKAAGYNVTNEMAEHWQELKVSKPRKKSKA